MSACPVADPDPSKGSSLPGEQCPQRSTTDVEQRDEYRGRFGTPWFARCNCGWGYRPATWQGWALAGLLVVLLYGDAAAFRAHYAAVLFAVLAVLAIGYILVARLTTRTL